MRNADNENDTWQPLSLAARRLLVRCEEQKKETDRETGRSDADDEDSRRHREAVNEGLKRLAAFERPYRRGLRERKN